MERVSQEEVVEEWLSAEAEKDDSTSFDIVADRENNQNLARLLAHKPDAAALFWEYDLEWYRHDVAVEEFRDLRASWGEQTPIFDIAQEISNGGSSMPPNMVRQVRTLSDPSLLGGWGPLIIYRKRWPRKYPYVADGNHRATALALHMLRGGDYRPQTAYVGYPTPITGAARKIRGAIHQVTNRL